MTEEDKKEMLAALAWHVHPFDPTDYAADFCAGCPYAPFGSVNGEPCDYLFLDDLPEVLRSFGDEGSLRFAAQIERCRVYDYDNCHGCDFFDVCFADENMIPVLKAVYDHLVSIGVYKDVV